MYRSFSENFVKELLTITEEQCTTMYEELKVPIVPKKKCQGEQPLRLRNKVQAKLEMWLIGIKPSSFCQHYNFQM